MHLNLPLRSGATLMIALAATAAPAAPFPAATVANDVVTMEVYLPDATRGFYRGTRFDRAGLVSALSWAGHTYFGPWRKPHEPSRHDHVVGPANEFSIGGDYTPPPVGYADAPVGGVFVKIGVGVLRKPDSEPYRFHRDYEIVDPGHWVTRTGDTWIEFVHTLDAGNGYAYRYCKRLTLPRGQPRLEVDRKLTNTGTRRLEAVEYCHNFFRLDDDPVGPAYQVTLPFAPAVKSPLPPNLVGADRKLGVKRSLTGDESVFVRISGFGAGATDHSFVIANTRTRAAVMMEGDQPVVYFNFWATSGAICPEPALAIAVDPGRSFDWRSSYRFFETAVP